MIQQIKNNKTDKQLTQNDLKRITYASCLNLFHSNTMFSESFGVTPVVEYYYTKRLATNNYQYQKSWMATNFRGDSSNFLNLVYYGVGSIQTKTMAQIEALNPDLLSDTDGTERLFIKYHYKKNR